MTKSLAALPVEGSIWLCQVDAGAVKPLVACPGSPKAAYVVSDDASALAVLESDRKRASLLMIVDDDPWLVPHLPFAALPRRCLGHVVAAIDGTLLVGGHGPEGEALWARDGAGCTTWRELMLPQALRQSGKAVDGLLRSDRRLIVIDDIVMPKWVLEYEILGGGKFSHIRTEQLPFHTTYERIYSAAIGEPGIGLLSHGINHGTVSHHVWILDTESLTEIRHSSGWSATWRKIDDNKPSGRQQAILRARALEFVQHILVVACGRRGMIVADVRTSPTLSTRGRRGMIPFRRFRLPALKTITRLVLPQPIRGDGLFAVGKTANGTTTSVWVPHDALVAVTAGS